MLTSVAQHHCSEQVTCFLLQCCSAKKADSTLASAQPHLCSSALHTVLPVLTSVAQHHCSEPVGCFLVQCCSAKHADSTLASAQPHLYSSALHTALLMLSSVAQHHGSEQQPELDRVTVPCCLSLHICMKCKTATH